MDTTMAVCLAGGKPRAQACRTLTPAETIGDLLDALAPEILPAVNDGCIHAVVDMALPFGEAGAALERLRSGQAEGKVVLRMP